jgi:gliding motility-associated protein GldM
MGHGKETPRQKMIGMMYLVLTAMLALNVSADILNGFVLVNKGMVKTTQNFVAKNETSYGMFEAAMDKTPEKVRPFRDAAFSVKEKADQLAFDIQELKVAVVRFCDGQKAPAIIENGWSVGGKTADEIDDVKINAKDNYDKPSQMFVLEGRGAELKQKIEAYRDFLVTLTEDAGTQKAIQDALNTDGSEDRNGTPLSWEQAHFEHIPLVAVLAMLSKMQSDVRNAEADIINNLLSQIGATDTKVNKMEAIVQSLSPSYILRGNEYSARVL